MLDSQSTLQRPPLMELTVVQDDPAADVSSASDADSQDTSLGRGNKSKPSLSVSPLRSNDRSKHDLPISPLHADVDTFSEPESNASVREWKPMEKSEFQCKFDLDKDEQVVESYSCALYLSNFPYHGRLYLTSNQLCFNGWRDTIYVAQYVDISLIEKKNTAFIVPNAIEIMVKGSKIFFASFVFRDECYKCLRQLHTIKLDTVAAMTKSPALEEKEEKDEEASITSSAATSEKMSPQMEVPPSPQVEASPSPQVEASPSPQVKMSPLFKESNVVASAPARLELDSAPGPDAILEEYDIVLDRELPLSLETVYSKLWIESSAFYRRLLTEGGDTDIDMPEWSNETEEYKAVDSADTFDGMREVHCTHHKKYLVGPSEIPTTIKQRYKWESDRRLVIAITTYVSDVPYCNYFRTEGRWVYTVGENDKCHLQVGFKVVFNKSTWLKKQIESSANAEAKESAVAWWEAAAKVEKDMSLATMEVPEASNTTELYPSIDEDELDKDGGNVGRSRTKSTEAPQAKTSVPRHQSVVNRTTMDSYRGWFVATVVVALIALYLIYRLSVAFEKVHGVMDELLVQQRQQQQVLEKVVEQLQQLQRG